MGLSFEKLSSAHNRAEFECGNAALDSYLKTQAGQDSRRDLSSVYVLTDNEVSIIGFYTLSQFSVVAHQIEDKTANKLPHKRVIPCTLLGRFAVDKKHKGKGFGEILLFDAMKRAAAISESISSFALIVDAKDEHSKQFYVKYGFKEFKDLPLRLFIPTSTIRKIG